MAASAIFCFRALVVSGGLPAISLSLCQAAQGSQPEKAQLPTPTLLLNVCPLPRHMQGVSKRALQWYSKCYRVASVTKMFTFNGVKLSIVQHHGIRNTIAELFLKHPALPVKDTLNRNYPR
jgi:hypothetical protein